MASGLLGRIHVHAVQSGLQISLDVIGLPCVRY